MANAQRTPMQTTETSVSSSLYIAAAPRRDQEVVTLSQSASRQEVQYFRVTGARVTVRDIPTQRVSLERPRLHLAAVLPCVCQCDDLSLLLAPPPLAGAPLACLPHTAKDLAVVAPAQSYVVERVLAVVAGNEFDETHNAGRHCCRSVWQRWNRVVRSGRYSCKSRLTF